MSRYRSGFLLIVVAALIVPSGASAKTNRYCRLFTPSDIGRGIHQQGLNLDVTTLRVPTTSGGRGSLVICDYRAATANVAESSVFTLPSAASARREFEVQVRAERQTLGSATRVSGPWHSAYMIARREIYVVKGRHLFRVSYESDVSARTLRGLAVRAARKL